jgi:hypothetical protein
MAIELLNNITDLTPTVEVVFPCGDTVELNKLSVLDYARYEGYIVDLRSVQYELYTLLSKAPEDAEDMKKIKSFNKEKRVLLEELADCIELVKDKVLMKYTPKKYQAELDRLGIDGLVALFEALLFGEEDVIEESPEADVKKKKQ